MILHVPMMVGGVAALVGAVALAVLGIDAWTVAALVGVILIGLLGAERLWAGIAAAWRFRDAAALLFSSEPRAPPDGRHQAQPPHVPDPDPEGAAVAHRLRRGERPFAA